VVRQYRLPGTDRGDMALLNEMKTRVQQVLARPGVRRVNDRTQRGVLNVLATNRATATIGFWLSPFGFNRERYAILTGRAAYRRNQDRVHATSPRLRRNIHRLEKALIMEPRRPRFALAYIAETVEAYELYQQDCSLTDAKLARWSTDVLHAYFAAVDKNDELEALETRFLVAAGEAPDSVEESHSPFLRGASPELTVAHEDLLNLAIRRRSVRWFEDRPVDRDLIDKALLVARQSPTACNRQPFEYRIYDDPGMVRKVAAIPFGAAGYHHNIPTVVVLVGKLDNFFSARDRHVIYIDASLSAMAFMLGLETVGLASSVINWPDFEPLERKMARVIGLEPYERVVMLLAVGHPRDDAGVPYSAKKSLEYLRSYNPVPGSST
jgi:nitroreductase